MALQAGRAFGNYRIVRLLGEGGFGEVYLAENPLLERRAAVKVLHTSLAQDPELVRRFLNEARAASAICHPNIIEIFDAGLTPEGAPYILMEFLEGISLQKRLAEGGRLDLGLALDIARQAGSALGAAHAAGIVHRDLKPENLFLVPDANLPSGMRVKILDFGIAKIRRGASGGTMQTQTGIIMGSPAYMSPEQCKDSADVDFRSDIYSFGVIMYETLSGKPPFVAATGTEMLVMQITTPPKPMRLADAPTHVEAAVMRALAKNRSERFDSVAAFVSSMLGEGVPTEIGFAAASPRLAAADQAQPAPSAAAPAVTTFSRSTGEVGISTGDEEQLAVARPRRWPIVALGGAIGAGLVLFLILHFSAGPSPRAGSGSSGVAVPAAASATQPFVPRLPSQERVAPPALRPSVPDAGTASASATALPARKPSAAAPLAQQPSPPPSGRKRPVSRKKDTGDEWELH